MDRFIERAEQMLKKQELYLKSNMDRFIGISSLRAKLSIFYLKSNMDRFIVLATKISLQSVNI